MTGTLTGNFVDEGTVVLLEVEGGTWIASDHRIADHLLVRHIGGEEVTISYEGWQVLGGKH